jgi:hypothetical protein
VKAGANLFGCSSAGEATQVLIVGCASRFPDAIDRIDGVSFAAFGDLTPDFMSRSMANVVLSALWTEEFDVIDLAGRLSHLGFSGRYRAISGGIPRPDLIVDEVRRVYPFLDFRILLYAGQGRLVSFAEYGARP